MSNGRHRSEGPDEMRKAFRKAFGEHYAALILNPNKPDYNQYIDNLDRFVSGIRRDVTTSQLRNVYSRVKQASDARALYRLRPKIAYTSGRAKKPGLKKLMLLLDDVIKAVDPESQEHVEEVKDFFEAVIAYHKYHGGSD